LKQRSFRECNDNNCSENKNNNTNNDQNGVAFDCKGFVSLDGQYHSKRFYLHFVCRFLKMGLDGVITSDKRFEKMKCLGLKSLTEVMCNNNLTVEKNENRKTKK